MRKVLSTKVRKLLQMFQQLHKLSRQLESSVSVTKEKTITYRLRFLQNQYDHVMNNHNMQVVESCHKTLNTSEYASNYRSI